MKHPLYYVQAYRWGSLNDHSYVVGIFSTYEEAHAAGIKEEVYRGGKYECVVYIADLNEPIEPWTDEATDDL